MNYEQLLALWLETEPTARSPYTLYGNPPMWETHREEGRVLFSRPCRTMQRPAAGAPYRETDGVAYQWQDGAGNWQGQGVQTTIGAFLEGLNSGSLLCIR